MVYQTLEEILEKLDTGLFVQAHRSNLVNKTIVTRIQRDSLILDDQTFLPIGQKFKKALLAAIGK